MERHFRLLIGCSMAIIAALLVVGAVSAGIIRHIVQRSALWIVIALAARRSGWGKWAALPCYVFWFLLMAAIWLFLLGWAKIVSGTFSPIEITMTVIVGLASVVGFVTAIRTKTNTSVWKSPGTVLFVAAVQLAFFG
jgi:hypothetical protein